MRSGGSDIRGFSNDTCAHLTGVVARLGDERVVVVGRRPRVDVVTDEGGGVSCAGDPEVGLACIDKGGHTGKGTGDPENRFAVILLPYLTNVLLNATEEEEGKQKGSYKGGTILELFLRHKELYSDWIIHY